MTIKNHKFAKKSVAVKPWMPDRQSAAHDKRRTAVARYPSCLIP